MEGDVVMVRLGADEGRVEADEAEEQGSSYMELKPSASLLVPLELMEGQDGVVDSSQLCLSALHQTIVPDDPSSETHSSFSLMLDVDEEINKDAGLPPMKNDLQFSDPPAVQASDEPMAKPEVILSDTDDQDALLSGEAFEEEQRKEEDMLDGVNVDGLTESAHVMLVDQADLQTQNTEVIHEPEDDKEQLHAELVMLAEDQEPAGLLASGPSPVELVAVVADSVEEKNAVEEDQKNTAEDQEEPEENGPVNIDTEIAHSTEMETVLDDKQHDHKAAETEEENNEEIKTNTETKRRGNGRSRQHKDVEEEEPVSNSQAEEQPAPETPSSQRKKKAPSTPTRRTTRGKMITFISPLPEEAEEPQVDGKVVEAETSTVVPVSPSRTPRKSKQNKEVKVRASTPRRSTRKAQQEAPKDEVEELVEALDHDATVPSTSKAPSPARRRVSQRVTSISSSQSSSQEVSPPTEVKIKVEQEDNVTVTKASQQTSSKTSTPAKRRTTQGNTPRRSSRRILSSSEALPTQLEILKEEKEQEEVFASPVKRNPRKIKTEPSEIQLALLEEKEDKNTQVSSPGRTTRQSSRQSLNVYPQVRIHKCISFCKLLMLN